ncbi:aroma-sacti cluster domain-containing protein [Nonomuraea sp. NPDC005650]|uniref:aroma-sacti cluster domain-containing protein n=1 Tax=Nonomuraea sp. NPDC005650 TaxID=3157045 RepID=UPI0033AC95F1
MADRLSLEALGFDLELATPEQRAVLESLTDDEIVLLADIKRRLEDADDDVEGHMEGGGFCW